jgi:glycosyltransferase involved in cell wall biosynthesis
VQGPDAFERWRLRATYFRRLLDLATRFIAPSRYIADYFASYGVPPGRIELVPNAVWQGARAHPLAPSAEPKRGHLSLAYIGTVIRPKGVDLVLEAIRSAGLSAVSLTVAGFQPDPRYVEELERKASELPGLEFTLRGMYESEELAEIFQHVDAAVVPSRVPESFSLTTREAFLQGVPAIVARIGALPEAIVEGVNGWTFAPDSVSDLAALLTRLRQDPDLVARAKVGASQTLVMNVAEHVQAVSRVYEKALRPAPPLCEGMVRELDELHDLLGQASLGK